MPIIPHSSSLASKPSSITILESISQAFSKALNISDLVLALEMPSEDPELAGLIKTGNFNFSIILKDKLFFELFFKRGFISNF